MKSATLIKNRRASDASPDVIIIRLEHLEQTVSQMNARSERIETALMGDLEKPGFLSRVAAQETAVASLQRNQRLAFIAFIGQALALLTWSFNQIYTNIST